MGVCESKANLAQQISRFEAERAINNADNADSHRVDIYRNDSEQIDDLKRDKIDSLQRYINILSAATVKIDGYKKEIAELKEMNIAKQKEVDDRDDVIYKAQGDMKEMGLTILTLQNRIYDEENKHFSINDKLLKIQGDTVSKLKYNKMSQKEVIFINGVNHLFYYDESASNNKSEPKCIKIRAISIQNETISKQIEKPWFLVIGEKRKAVFVAESTSMRDKWVNFIKLSLENKQIQNPNYPKHENHETVQSLISIIASLPSPKCTKICPSEQFETTSLQFKYPRQRAKSCTISNNGHTVQINVNSNLCTLSIRDKMYKLQHFHFHSPSEHTIDAKQHEMEMHLVHVNEQKEIAVLSFIFSSKIEKENVKLQLTKNKTHLILGDEDEESDDMETDAECDQDQDQEQDDDDEDTENEDEEETDDDEEEEEPEEIDHEGNDFLAQFWDQLPLKKTKEDVVLSKALSFEYLLKTSSDNFVKNVKTNEVDVDLELFEYKGSLKIPPYTEGVQWMISKKVHYVGNKQLTKLKKIWFRFL